MEEEVDSQAEEEVDSQAEEGAVSQAEEAPEDNSLNQGIRTQGTD